jgi:hypothetical protein
VILRGNQHEALARRLWLRCAAERSKDAEDDRVSGENAQSNRRDNSGEENHGHEERSHDQPTLSKVRLPIAVAPDFFVFLAAFFANFAATIEPQSARRIRKVREAIRNLNRRESSAYPH